MQWEVSTSPSGNDECARGVGPGQTESFAVRAIGQRQRLCRTTRRILGQLTLSSIFRSLKYSPLDAMRSLAPFLRYIIEFKVVGSIMLSTLRIWLSEDIHGARRSRLY